MSQGKTISLMNEEIKEAFSRLYFSPDEVNQQLAIAMKSLITKEDFIDILVDRYTWYLKNGEVMTKRYTKHVKYFAEMFRMFLVFNNVYRGDFEPIYRTFQKKSSSKKAFPRLHHYARILDVGFMTFDFVDFESNDIIRIPSPNNIVRMWESLEILQQW